MRIGILGCGRMGHERARTTNALGHELVVVYDPDVERAKPLAAGYSGCHVAEHQDDIAWRTLDAIFICTPPYIRSEYELRAIDTGLPFFVEKPIGVTSADCPRVLQMLNRRPTIHAVGYMNRCRASVMFAREMLGNSDVLGICCHWMGRKYKVPWWLEPEQCGGPLNEQATHAFDLCRLLTGEISHVSATSRIPLGSAELPLSVASTLNFRNGSLGTILYSCEADDKHINLRVITAGGLLEFSGWDMRLTANTVNEVIPVTAEEDIFLVESARFLNAVEKGDQSLVACDLRDAYRTQLAVDAAVRSLRTGQRTSTQAPLETVGAV